MGVIRWKEQYPGRWYGYLGKLGVADVVDFGSAVVWTLPDTLRLPDGDEEFVGGSSAGSIEAAKATAEGFVAKWMTDAGLVPKSAFDELKRSSDRATRELSALKSHWEVARADIEKAVMAWAAADKTEHLRLENDRLKRVLKKIRREVDRETNLDIYGRVMRIVNDAHEWAKDTPPKLRTEADFRNADIDQRGYVTFRDGGAA